MSLSSVPIPENSRDVGYWKQFLRKGRDQARDDYSVHGNCTQLTRRLSKLVDTILVSIWKKNKIFRSNSLVAVGGYGRGSLCPYSDIDILTLVPNHESEKLEVSIEGFVSFLWDIGLELGHSVRTPEECLKLAKHDISVQTSLLESRLLCGNEKLFLDFSSKLAIDTDIQVFYNSKVLEQQQRHARFYNASFNLEPNIKTAPGGIRDLQTILWIARARKIGDSWTDLVHKGLLTRKEVVQINRDERFLTNLRIRLHYLAGRREDRLLFDYQKELAVQFMLVDKPVDFSGERLMQTFYRTTKRIGFLNEVLLNNLRDEIFCSQVLTEKQLNDRFHVRNGLLELKHDKIFFERPSSILESFLLLQRNPEIKGMGASTLQAMRRAQVLINTKFRQNPVNRNLFMEILKQNFAVTRELGRMNQYGVLGRYLPAWGKIVGQMQHDLYHVYTVDEHILTVVRNLRRFSIVDFAHEYPLCSKLMSDCARPEVLYVAGLFHDIAKGRGGDHSTLGAVDAHNFCKNHNLLAEDRELVTWLVENHLLMSSTAQKQDLFDPRIISNFALKVSTDRRLVCLYLLTVADIRGTSPKVWNAWKAKLLEDLFHLTRAHLTKGSMSIESTVQGKQNKALDQLRLYAIPDDACERLWAQLDTAYFLRHDEREIAWHTRVLNYRVNTAVPVVKARLSPVGEGLQVLAYVVKNDVLFAQICSFFESIRYTIVEAKIYTTRHGYALNSFQVMDPDNKISHYRDVISFVEHGLIKAISTESIASPTRGRISRQMRYFPFTPQIAIRPGEKTGDYSLSIIAGDRLGLLSRVAQLFLKYKISVYNAKVNTLGERAEDNFLIRGDSLEDSQNIIRLETELMQELQTDTRARNAVTI